MPTTEKSSLEAPASRPLGIIAGAGALPRALADRCREKNIPVAVVALRGFAHVNDLAPDFRIDLPIGRGRAMINFFHEHHVQDIVMVGAVRRPSLWDVRPDWWTFTRLARILRQGGLGDDGLLRAIKTIFETEGFRVQGVQTYLPDLIAPQGALTALEPAADDRPDIVRGFAAARALGAADVGQSVVVQGGIILGVEAAEGTGALIKRCGELKRAGPGPILVKATKPGQDRTLDLPTIGPDTVRAAIAAGFRGITVQASGTLVIEPIEMAALADQAEFFIWGEPCTP